MSDNLWICEDCNDSFAIGQGVIGTPSDLQIVENEESDEFECSPFAHIVVLCNKCYQQKLESK